MATKKVRLILKYFKVPLITDSEGIINHSPDHTKFKFIKEEERETEEANDVIKIAQEIKSKNDRYLAMARNDNTIEMVTKIILCK
jgi:hypothetical protein